MALKLFALLLCASLPSLAQSQKAFPYEYTQEDLPNGLRLVTVPTDYANIVATYIVVRAGARNEVEEGHTGFAHLFEHLMFRGTPKMTSEQYNQTLNRIGASSNASTSDDWTIYHTTYSKEDLETVVAMEADRFQNLKFAEAEFKTESLAVLGEYNKNSASPFSKMEEVVRDTAYDRHTYKHTAMGFLRDIQAMPQQYEYSLKFFDRYYRPEYTTILVVGDVEAKRVRALVDKYWGAWKRGSYSPDIPVEPAQAGPRTGHVDWPSPTLPLVSIAFKAPAYDDSTRETAALDALANLAFGSTSELYQQLVVKEQRADAIFASAPENRDAGLFEIMARAKKPADLDYVRERILETVQTFRDKPVDGGKLDTVRRRLRYQVALSMDNSDTIAQIVASYLSLKRTPETMNALYEQYAKLTPEDLQQAARKYLTENHRTIVTLTGPAASGPGGAK